MDPLYHGELDTRSVQDFEAKKHADQTVVLQVGYGVGQVMPVGPKYFLT